MAYIAVGSYVYITFFGLSELAYSVLLRRRGARHRRRAASSGSFASRFVSARTFTTILLAVGAAAGVAMLAVGIALARPLLPHVRGLRPGRGLPSGPTARTSCCPSRSATRAPPRRSSTSPTRPSAAWACCVAVHAVAELRRGHRRHHRGHHGGGGRHRVVGASALAASRFVGIKQHPATAGSSAESGELEAAAAGASEQVPEQPA